LLQNDTYLKLEAINTTKVLISSHLWRGVGAVIAVNEAP
jgi:hypothetical protein